PLIDYPGNELVAKWLSVKLSAIRPEEITDQMYMGLFYIFRHDKSVSQVEHEKLIGLPDSLLRQHAYQRVINFNNESEVVQQRVRKYLSTLSEEVLMQKENLELMSIAP